ncbi:MAG: class II glutamine amidotransferase [Melioribacteraceae bacterium]|nr:class II glutamine amidotransferase [Melioribacteraceae bacterium]
MCGIMGYYCFGEKRPSKEHITEMFSLLETRGRDASGFAFIENGQLIVQKAAVKSSEFVKMSEWQNVNLSKSMILHTRAATQGTNKNNQNNHPLFTKQGVCIVHNGIIYNDKEIFGKNQRDGEVDSEAILAVLSSRGKGDKIKRVFDRLEGSFAFAVISKDEPDKLTLVKKDNPIDLYYDEKNDILYFCSERRIMQEGMKLKTHSHRGFNLGEEGFHFYEIKNNHSLVIGPEGVESYRKYSPRQFMYSSHDHYFGRQADNDELVIECPWCLEQTRYHLGKLFNRCEQCGLEISEEELFQY